MSGHHHDHGGTAKTVAFNLAVNLFLTLAKWLAFALTGSPSLFGEAAHSTADSLNPILLWTGHRRGQRPKDGRHPFGHSRETFFWSLVAAQLMLLVGSLLTAYRGTLAIMTGAKPDYSPWSLGIMAFALLAESCTLTLAWRKINRERGANLAEKIGGSHDTVLLGVLLENGVDALGVILAFAGFGLFVLTGEPLWDAAFSLLIALTLFVSSVFLINRSRSLLTGEAAPADTVAEIRRALAGRAGIAEILEITAVLYGSERVHCRLRLRLDAEWFADRWCSGPASQPYLAGDPVLWTLQAVRAELAGIKAAVRAGAPEVRSVEIEYV